MGKASNGNTYWGFMGTGILIVGTLGEFYDLWCMYIYICIIYTLTMVYKKYYITGGHHPVGLII
jgi:hypothetical protein